MTLGPFRGKLVELIRSETLGELVNCLLFVVRAYAGRECIYGAIGQCTDVLGPEGLELERGIANKVMADVLLTRLQLCAAIVFECPNQFLHSRGGELRFMEASRVVVFFRPRGRDTGLV